MGTAAYACSPGAEALSPSPKTLVVFPSPRRVLCVRLRGRKTASERLSRKVREVAFARAKARTCKAALEKTGVVSERKRGGDLATVLTKSTLAVSAGSCVAALGWNLRRTLPIAVLLVCTHGLV